MSTEAPETTDSPAETSLEPETEVDVDDEISERMATRRGFMKAAGVAGATAVGIGASAGNAAALGDVGIDFSHEYAHDPFVNATITVDSHEPDFEELDYIADDDTRTSLKDSGVVLASNHDESTPHNPVTLKASNFITDEYTAFPRDVKYDSDGDGDVDSDDEGVSVLDSTHWTTTNSTNGTISVTDVTESGPALQVASSTVPAGETVKATFDLSTVGSKDATITEGMSRRFLQQVTDIDLLESGVVVTFAVIDSAGNEVTATIDPAGDASTTSVLASSQGDSKVREVRVGELENAQSVTLGDIQKLQIRISEANADLTFHGLNLGKSEQWDFGTEQFLNSDSKVDTRSVYEPTGTFTITSLSTLPTMFSDAEIKNVQYDAEMRASHLPSDQLHARVNDSPSGYSRPDEVEYVAEFEWPSAYALTVNAGAAEDRQQLPNGRYVDIQVATGINDIDEWSDIEDSISWTSKKSSYTSIDKLVTLLSSTSSSDRTAVRVRSVHNETESTAMTSTSGSTPQAATTTGGGGGGFSALKTLLMGGLAAIGLWKRKAIAALFG